MQKVVLSSNSAKYSSSNLLKRILLDRFLFRLMTQIEKTKASSLLDVGCGEGFVAQRILSKHSLDYTGIDQSDLAITHARQQNPTGRFQCASAYALPFQNNQFDTSICAEVLEHLDEPEKAIEELCRVTRGTVIFSVPNEPFFQLGNLLGLSHVSTLGTPPDHVNRWSIKTFETFLSPFVEIQHVEKPFPWQILTTTPLEPSSC